MDSTRIANKHIRIPIMMVVMEESNMVVGATTPVFVHRGMVSNEIKRVKKSPSRDRSRLETNENTRESRQT